MIKLTLFIGGVIILGFWLSIITGGNRFSHTDWLRYDTTLQSIFELDKLPSSRLIFQYHL
ncbi:hypothetical protein [Aliarcobacter cibarius]|uniref:hypothetical protein n=1 Tax=Aliarcobacter cibarius TaxID=255507 RepID=UPI001245B83C|nr:hypothetical protein [Aliarcobacter cibarius]